MINPLSRNLRARNKSFTFLFIFGFIAFTLTLLSFGLKPNKVSAQCVGDPNCVFLYSMINGQNAGSYPGVINMYTSQHSLGTCGASFGFNFSQQCGGFSFGTGNLFDGAPLLYASGLPGGGFTNEYYSGMGASGNMPGTSCWQGGVSSPCGSNTNDTIYFNSGNVSGYDEGVYVNFGASCPPGQIGNAPNGCFTPPAYQLIGCTYNSFGQQSWNGTNPVDPWNQPGYTYTSADFALNGQFNTTATLAESPNDYVWTVTPGNTSGCGAQDGSGRWGWIETRPVGEPSGYTGSGLQVTHFTTEPVDVRLGFPSTINIGFGAGAWRANDACTPQSPSGDPQASYKARCGDGSNSPPGTGQDRYAAFIDDLGRTSIQNQTSPGPVTIWCTDMSNGVGTANPTRPNPQDYNDLASCGQIYNPSAGFGFMFTPDNNPFGVNGCWLTWPSGCNGAAGVSLSSIIGYDSNAENSYSGGLLPFHLIQEAESTWTAGLANETVLSFKYPIDNPPSISGNPSCGAQNATITVADPDGNSATTVYYQINGGPTLSQAAPSGTITINMSGYDQSVTDTIVAWTSGTTAAGYPGGQNPPAFASTTVYYNLSNSPGGAACQPPPPVLTPFCSAGQSMVSISWSESPGVGIGPGGATGFYVDIANDPSYNVNHYFKWAGNVNSTTAPPGFVLYGVGTAMPALNPGSTYYARINNGQFSANGSFVALPCPPPTPTISQYCDAQGFDNAVVSWPAGTLTGSAGIYIDVSTNPAFAPYYNHGPLGGNSDTIPANYYGAGFGTPMPPLSQGTTYYLRLFSDAYNPSHSNTASFVANGCPPSTPTASTFCSADVSSVTISWSGQPGNIGPGGASGFYVDLANDPSFTVNHYFKWAGNVTSTQAPGGFILYGVGTPMPSLTGGATYYMRINNGQFSGVSSFVAATCQTPTARVYGGDVVAGSEFGSQGNCPASTSPAVSANAGIISWNNTGANGAGTQIAAQAMSQIFGFATNYNSGGGGNYAALSFANSNPAITSPAAGEFGGNFGYAPCAPKYQPPATGTVSWPGSFTAAPGSYSYTWLGGIINAGTIPAGVNITLYVNGSVEIAGNITYGTTGWTNPSQIPSFRLVVTGGDINVDSSVTQLDGQYVAQPTVNLPNPPTGGSIYTCSQSGAPHPVDGNYYTDCSSQLVINGSFVARQVKLMRACNTMSNSNTGQTSVATGNLANCSGTPGNTTAAEVFNYSPEVWLAQPPGATASSLFDSIINLPPIL